jgi:hypothetical protein
MICSLVIASKSSSAIMRADGWPSLAARISDANLQAALASYSDFYYALSSHLLLIPFPFFVSMHP